MYRPLEENEKMESFSTHKCQETGLIFMGDFKKGEKVWLNLRAHFYAWDSYMMRARPVNLKGLAVFFLHKYTHSERFSIRSPKPSALRRLNGCFLALRDMGGKELFFKEVPNSANIAGFFSSDNGALLIRGAVECRAMGLNIFAPLPIGEN